MMRIVCGTLLAPIALAMMLSAAPADVEAWTERLEELMPRQAIDYFNLAEEVADAAESDAERELARHLFKLAGVLDRDQLGRSAALALADLSLNREEKRRYLALAGLLDRTGVPNWLPGETQEHFDPAAVVALCEAFALYRSGRGQQAIEVLDDAPQARALFERYGDRIGGVQRFITNARIPQYNDGVTSPLRSQRDVAAMLELEAALLGGENRSWAAELYLHDGRTLVEVDPAQLEHALDIDAGRAYFRNGGWTADP